VVEVITAIIRNDTNIVGIPLVENNTNVENFKIQLFADDTITAAANHQENQIITSHLESFKEATTISINESKCVTIAFDDNANIDGPTLKPGETFRYLGYELGSDGIVSQLPSKINQMKNQALHLANIASTLQGRLVILLCYILSQLTFHQYVNNLTTDQEKELDHMTASFVYGNHTGRWAMCKERSHQDYENGGLQLKNYSIRSKAQIAFSYERFLHDWAKTKSTNTYKSNIIYFEAWINNIENNKPSRILRNCWECWKSLLPIGNRSLNINDPINCSPFFRDPPKLKKIYRKMMDINNINWNKYKPTPGQVKLAKEIGNPLPFIEVGKIKSLKGRDLLSRYIRKCIYKDPSSICPHCHQHETTSHLFFECQIISKYCQPIIDKFTIDHNLHPLTCDNQF
jgi:hypothetical protein